MPGNPQTGLVRDLEAARADPPAGEPRQGDPEDVAPRHLMMVPSAACPARCLYCFGPHEGRGVMTPETVDGAIRFFRPAGPPEHSLEITFHGGEPLAAGRTFFEDALGRLERGFHPHRVRFALQSNLWLLTPELCSLFRDHGVSLGSSLDGPREVTDRQRGEGYFDRTLAGFELARRNGLEVGCICTFTSQSFARREECFEFFAKEGLPFTVHAAVPSLQHPEARSFALTPEGHGGLMSGALEWYLANLQRVKIGTLDAMCRSVSSGCGGICTFTDCLGSYLAVGPDGEIYPCQRFVSACSWSMGNVRRDTWETVRQSAVWRRLREREKGMAGECGDCPYFAFCKGGCPYNALAAGGDGNGAHRDPHCPGYRRVFGEIAGRAADEVFAEDNLRAVVDRIDERKGLLRRGKLLALMGPGPHPYDIARHARRIVAAVVLAVEDSPEAAAQRMAALGLDGNPPRTLAALRKLRDTLENRTAGLNNLYLHVTLGCNLRCTHCYASAGAERAGALAPQTVARLASEAAALGFRHAVVTGGEPLVHPERDALLDALAVVRETSKPLLTVLRTNLAAPLDAALMARLGASTDEVVVSVDGDRETHDARRGAGTYERTVANLRALMETSGDVSIACVLPSRLVRGEPGESVRRLAETLGIRRVRFRPVLPLGRALREEPGLAPDTPSGSADPEEMLEQGFHPAASCGLGQNVYVEPDGSAFPCYAWHGGAWRLGSLLESSLEAVVSSPGFSRLRGYTVNTNRRCRACALRYLCGGACRAWNNVQGVPQDDLDAPPRDCSGLERRAALLLRTALTHLGASQEDWRRAGLPRSAVLPLEEGECSS